MTTFEDRFNKIREGLDLKKSAEYKKWQKEREEISNRKNGVGVIYLLWSALLLTLFIFSVGCWIFSADKMATRGWVVFACSLVPEYFLLRAFNNLYCRLKEHDEKYPTEAKS